ncbi:hypothetical protein A2377_00300 [Candidatus Roizmanbacteria bacterium RIFOXYB1_FULL_41_27]|nr:MAG: hypothetical protein A2377_00300 [Candidatus Roizmanbacteria bacterium RIFOXYB1_FULL_41_27]
MNLKLKFYRKLFSLLSFISILFQSLYPYLASIPLVRAQEKTQAQLEYSTDTNKFKVSVNSQKEIKYSLIYRQNDQNEVIQGTAEQSDRDFEREFYAGTCSSDDSCVPHQILRGILKIEMVPENFQSLKKFIWENNNIKIVEEEESFDSLELSDAEKYWLETGEEFVPTATPTPTGEILEEAAQIELTPTPTTIVSLSQEGDIETQIIEASQCFANSLNGCVITDKDDYHPNEVVLITGHGFLPNSPYILVITSPTGPLSVNFDITSNDQGSFEYSYQLDGTYRPDYNVFVYDTQDNLVAQTTFTDSVGNPNAGVSVTICHATNSHSHPYQINSPSIDNFFNQGHDHHDGDNDGEVWYPGIADHSWGDIIPPFTYDVCPAEDSDLYSADNDSSLPCEIGNGRNKKYADYIIGTYPGKNWPVGQSILENDCKVSGEVETSTVTVCKQDIDRNYLSGWEVALATESDKVDGPTSINVSNGDGTDSKDLAAGKYLLKVSGTYRYGNSSMIADAAFSFRPVGIPDGIGDWVSGFDLSSGSNGLMAWINGVAVHWGPFKSDHVYYYLYEHTSSGSINFSIYDNNYGDNLNNNFQFEIYQINSSLSGITGENGCVDFTSVDYGDYYLSEILQNGWDNVSGEGIVTVDDPTETFILTNRLLNPPTSGSLTVCKYNDLDMDGEIDENEPKIEWDVTVADQSETIPAGECLELSEMDFGEYEITEAEVAGWTRSFPTDSNSQTVILSEYAPDQTVNFLNYEIPPVGELTISKYNDLWPVDQTPGAVITFTITIKANNGRVNDVIVVDLMPAGFSFNGTWEVKDKDGNEIIVDNPNYHSPGEWKLGDMEDGDEITITFPATIAADQDLGLYKDLAYAYGIGGQEELVYASSEPSGQTDPGEVTEEYVGTQVNLVKDTQDSETFKVEKEEERTGSVLGASTSLPATGANSNIINIALFIFCLSLLSVLALIKKRGQMLIMLLAGFVSLLVFSHSALAIQSLTVRLEQPKSPTNNNTFKLVFTTMDMNGQAIIAKCLKKGPAEASFSQFGSNIAISEGGNSGICQINSGVMNNSGTYQFMVTVSAGAETDDSDVVTVDYNTATGPGTPTSYGKSKLNNGCEYKITAKSADDSGKTVKIELYRSDNLEFTADALRRIHTFNVGSNSQVELTNSVPDCSKDYYYALRAFDTYGNGSGLVGDENIKVTYVGQTTTESTTQNTQEAVLVAGGAAIAAEPGQAVEEISEADQEASEGNKEESTEAEAEFEGEVLGEQKAQNVFTKIIDYAKANPLTTFLIIGGLAIILYASGKVFKKK